MRGHKAFRYRVYPTRQQEERLLRWESSLRWLWNLALEQRRMGLARLRDERIFLTAFDQINELKALREQAPWLTDVPRNVCAQRIEVPTPPPRTEPVVAIDRGVTQLLADSDGRLTPNPRHLERTLKRLAHAQRVVSRRKKGSKNREKAKARVMRLHCKVRRQREHVLHELSAAYAKNHGTVVVEKLNVAGMIRGWLSRSIADAAWSHFAQMLRYKLASSGGTLVEVPPAYSSQTRSKCGHVDAASRSGERFSCTACGYLDHADLNAAKVLKSRANRSALPVEASALAGLRSGKVRKRLRVPRRSSSQSPVPSGRG